MIEIQFIREAVEAVLEIAPYPHFVKQMKEWHGIEVRPINGAFTERRTPNNDSRDHTLAEMALIWAQDAIRYEFETLPFNAGTPKLQKAAMRDAEAIARRAIVYAKEVKQSLMNKTLSK